MSRILVIEDTDVTRNLIVRTLEKDYLILATDNGMDGVRLAQEQQPHLVLCDISMPEMDGYEVLRALRSHPGTQNTPFVFLTALADREHMRSGMNLGADDYLTKPFSLNELREAVAAAFQKHARHETRLRFELETLRKNITTALPHELRTIVMVLEGYVQVMLNDDSTQPHHDLLTTMGDYAKRLNRLSDKFLCYSELQLPRRDEPIVPTLAPDEAIDNTARERATSLCRIDDLQLDLHRTPVGLPEHQLRRMVAELVENACIYSEPGTPIRVSACAEGAAYYLSVSDRGRGMKQQQINSVGAFMQFERDVYEQQGTGLGLIIVKRLVQRYGGEFLIDSIYGQGTTATCLLPLAQLNR